METLQIFPRGIDQSILSAVLVGLAILLFLTESFGWVYAGLIVPGYLASVFAFSPAAGVAVALEAVLTFLVARAISDSFSRSGAGAEFFGRDRFFLIVVVSVIVRQVAELWVLPMLSRAIDARYGTTLALDSSLSSIGLVLVPLTANCFWKLDLPRGLLQIGLPTFLTYVVIAFVLLPNTNLSFAHQELTYEDSALDFLESPKAYVILLTAAYLASRFNLDYGWDYNGILVPGLLALTWFSPLRSLATIAETLVIYGLARAFARLPVVRSWNLEGPRRVAMVFGMSLLLRTSIAFVIGESNPDIHASDLFGFGYLLPSLLAAKMIQAKAVGRVLMPAIHASLVGFVAGSLVGFLLELGLPRPTTSSPARSPTTHTVGERSDALTALVDALGRARADVPVRARNATLERPLTLALSESFDATDTHALAHLTAAARQLSLSARELAGSSHPSFALVEETAPAAAQRETWLVHRGAPGPIVVASHPASEPRSVLGAHAVCARVDCVAIVVSASDREDNDDAWRSVAEEAQRPLVVVREDASQRPGAPRVSAAGTLPRTLAFGALLPGTELVLNTGATPNGALILRAHPDDLVQEMAPVESLLGTREGELVLHDADGVDGEPLYSPPDETALRLLSNVITPALLRGARGPTPMQHAEFALAATLAQRLAYRVVLLPDGVSTDVATVALVERGTRRLGWGSLLIRIGSAHENIAVFAPRPNFEHGTARLAFGLANAWNARVIVLGGADFEASTADDSGWQWSAQNTPLFAFHLALVHHLGESAAHAESPALIHVRGVGSWRPLPDAMVVGIGSAKLHETQPGERLRSLIATPALSRFTPMRWVDGASDTIGLEGSHDACIRFSQETDANNSALLWFTEEARRPTMRASSADLRQQAQGIGLTQFEGGARRWLDETLEATHDRENGSLEARIHALASASRLENVHTLAALARDSNTSIVWGEDVVLGQGWLGLEIREPTRVLRIVALGANAHEPVEWVSTHDELEPALLRATMVGVMRSVPLSSEGAL